MNKIVFILSQTRSGSTWLSYVLGSHNSTSFVGEYYRPFILKHDSLCCRLCQGRGEKKCSVLGDLSKIGIKDAYQHAFEKTGKNILVDCSKQMSWVDNFIGEAAYEVKIIHLLRDPRAWFSSERKRNPMEPLQAMERWLRSNKNIEKYIQNKKLPSIKVFYDDLCAAPDLHFPKLTNFIGFDYHPEILNYWTTEHHGFAANGAAFNNMGWRSDVNLRRVGGWCTADDKFYRKNAKKLFFDLRWLKDLNEADRKEIENLPSVNSYLSSCNRSIAHFDNYHVT
jgi:hypothetical protein